MLDISVPEVMYNWARQRPEKIIDRPSPSQLGGCQRVHFYKIKHVAALTPSNPGAILNFQVGFLWEKIVTDALRANKIAFLDQYSMHSVRLNLSGTLDFAPFDPETNELEIWDSKTEGTQAASWRRKQKKTFFEVHPEYAIQLTCYALMAREQGFKVEQGRFIVIDKNDGSVTESNCTFTDELVNKTMNRLNILNQYLQTNTLPPCTCEGWRVGYCDYGNPKTQQPNSTKKVVNTECCGNPQQLKEWRA